MSEMTSTNGHILAPSSSGQPPVSLHLRKVVGQRAVPNTIPMATYITQGWLPPDDFLPGPFGTGKREMH